jgi:hypothetical protein
MHTHQFQADGNGRSLLQEGTVISHQRALPVTFIRPSSPQSQHAPNKQKPRGYLDIASRQLSAAKGLCLACSKMRLQMPAWLGLELEVGGWAVTDSSSMARVLAEMEHPLN